MLLGLIAGGQHMPFLAEDFPLDEAQLQLLLQTLSVPEAESSSVPNTNEDELARGSSKTE